jgi:Trk K+ transport system NAD-binding subunit
VLELPLALGAFVAGLVASVLSIVRDGREIHSPAADLCLAPSDLLVVLGNHEQLDRIRDLVAGKLQDWTPGSTRA